MKRMVWIAVAILVMIGILGYGLHTLNRIDQVNKERREKEAGEEFAAQISVTTETQSVWDKVRSSQETTTVVTDANGDAVPVQEAPTETTAKSSPQMASPAKETEPSEGMPADEGEVIVPDSAMETGVEVIPETQPAATEQQPFTIVIQ